MTDADDEAMRRAAVDAFKTRLDAPVVALRSEDDTGSGPQRVRRLSFRAAGEALDVEVRHANGEFLIHLQAELRGRNMELWGPDGRLADFEPDGAAWQARTAFTGPVRGVVFQTDGRDRTPVLQTEWFALR